MERVLTIPACRYPKARWWVCFYKNSDFIEVQPIRIDDWHLNDAFAKFLQCFVSSWFDHWSGKFTAFLIA